MADGPSQLPPKQEVALALLQTASSVYVHLDPRPDDVMVPLGFKKQPQLVLQIGLNMAVQIPDLDIGEEGISCTLSFNRRAEFCQIPYSAIYGLVGEDGRGMIWPESVPPEVAASADGRSPVAASPKARRPKLRVATEESPVDLAEEEPEPTEEIPDAPAQQLVPTEAATEATGSDSDESAETAEKSGKAEQAPASKGKRELPPYLRVVK